MEILWLVFALLCALCDATRIALSKKTLQNVNEYTVNWAMRAFTVPFVVIPLFFVGIPEIQKNFWYVAVGIIPLAVLANIFYMRAIKISPLSLTIPFLSFTPVFLLFTSPIMLGEMPSALGIIGVLFVVAGSYVINIKKGSLLGPIKSIWIERGSMLILGVAFIYSITSNIDKIGVLKSSPFFWAFVFNLFLAFAFLPLMLKKSKKAFKEIKKNYKSLFGIGFFNALTTLFMLLAFKLTFVSYVVSVKRLSSLFGIIYGFWLFKEKDIKKRLAGAALMLVGVIVITFS
ncbi:MAG: EamA family transporter [bacterium]|nr:EamA family transporter [bacterium]